MQLSCICYMYFNYIINTGHEAVWVVNDLIVAG